MGADASTYIQSDKTLIDSRTGIANSLIPTRIINNSLSTRTERRNLLRDTLGNVNNTFQVVITERVLSSLTDTEAQDISTKIRADILAATGTLIHIEINAIPGDDPTFNFKTLDAWKTLLPNDVIVDTGGGRILI